MKTRAEELFNKLKQDAEAVMDREGIEYNDLSFEDFKAAISKAFQSPKQHKQEQATPAL